MNIVSQDTTITVTFDYELDPQGTADVENYVVTSSQGVPLRVLNLEVFGRFSLVGSMSGTSAVQFPGAVNGPEKVLLPSLPARYTGVNGARLQLSRPTSAKDYWLEVRGLKRASDGSAYGRTQKFSITTAAAATVAGAQLLDEGQLIVTFSQLMRLDDTLLSV